MSLFPIGSHTFYVADPSFARSFPVSDWNLAKDDQTKRGRPKRSCSSRRPEQQQGKKSSSGPANSQRCGVLRSTFPRMSRQRANHSLTQVVVFFKGSLLISIFPAFSMLSSLAGLRWLSTGYLPIYAGKITPCSFREFSIASRNLNQPVTDESCNTTRNLADPPTEMVKSPAWSNTNNIPHSTC